MTDPAAPRPAGRIQVRVAPVPSATEAVLASDCLSAAERDLMAQYRHPRRRTEFVAGRLALKRALIETQGPAVRIGDAAAIPTPLLSEARRLQILPDGDGRPRLWFENALAPTQLSITHAAGWAAGACSTAPIGIDIVDLDAAAPVPDDSRWLSGTDPAWRLRLRSLLWGLRECLLKTGRISATTVWDLDGVDAVPTRSAQEIIASWPPVSGITPIEVQIEDNRVEGAFVVLSRSTILVIVSAPSLQ